MVDPLLQNPSFNDDIDPVEAEKTILGFLGQTYAEISKYDNHLVSTNPFLAPKKQEFHRTAEQVLRETRGIQPNLPHQQQPVSHSTQIQQTRLDPTPYLDTDKAPVPPSIYDPNQLEFSFDNSVTAKSIDNKLDEIEKRIKRLDITLQKVLSYIESHDFKDSKQE